MQIKRSFCRQGGRKIFISSTAIFHGYADQEELHQKACNLLAFHFDEPRHNKEDLFAQLHNTEKVSIDAKEIIPSAAGGRVDSLFVNKNEEVWGVYDPKTAEVRIHEKQHLSNTALTNMAAIYVFLNGGKVYLEEKENMPDASAVMNSLYRY